MNPTEERAVLELRITEYLSGGGLFNPEYAIHDAVRDLLIDCRAALTSKESDAEPVPEWVTALGNQYGCRQAAQLRGDKEGVMAANYWMMQHIEGHWHEVITQFLHPTQHKLPEGCMWAVTKGGRTICQPPRRALPRTKTGRQNRDP